MADKVYTSFMMVFKITLLLVTQVNSGWFDNCGRFSSTCVRENSVNTEEYLSLSAADKKTKLMNNVLSNTNSGEWFNPLRTGAGIMKESMCPTFREKGDELPWERGLLFYHNRHKFIHSVGVVGTFEWKSVGSHPYTGVFKGSQHALVRMSLAAEPDPEEQRTIPGMALKFLRDGIDSGNMVAMFSVDGQDSWNFFKNNFTNHIPALASAATAPLAVKFATATKHIQQVGLSNMAMYGQDGVKVDNPIFPYSLNFVPTVTTWDQDEYIAPVNDLLVTIPSGDVIFNVYAMDKPAELGGTETKIAEMVLTSQMTTSQWGDQHLFFRHQVMDDDISQRPEWDQHLEKWTTGIQTCSRISLLN